MEGVLAVVTCFAADFAPRGWALCNGQSLAVNTNQALFSLLGTTYGGNGQTTFNLPDLRGRTAISQGQGQGLANYVLGQVGGSEAVPLTQANLPPHVHTGPTSFKLLAGLEDASEPAPNDAFPSRFTGAYNSTANATMQAPAYTGTIANAGGGQPYNIRSPYLAINYIICLQGLFPSRN